MRIRKLPIKEKEAKKVRVAAYARVSTKSELLLRSLSNQVSYYTKLITNHKDWEFVEVYVDEGITGTNIDERTQFKKMMKDAQNGRFDILLTKSVSRFARNTVDLLDSCRELKSLGVEVKFEKDNISTFDGQGEIVLSLLASFAQAESESISSNVKWSKQRQMQQGIYHHFQRCYGYEWVGDEYKIVVSEAKIVKFIFQSYIDGLSPTQIAKRITSNTVNGKKFTRGTVKDILKNIIYTGDRELQKYYAPKLRSKAINYGQVPKYLLSNVHEPIIDKETFGKVQILMKNKASQAPKKTFTCFSGKIVCGHCGRSCCRRTLHGKKIWKCQGNEISKTCSARYITEENLKKYTYELFSDEATFIEKVKLIHLYDDFLIYILRNDKQMKIQRKEVKRNASTKKGYNYSQSD